MPEFYVLLPEKYFFRILGGGGTCPLPLSPTPMHTALQHRTDKVQPVSGLLLPSPAMSTLAFSLVLFGPSAVFMILGQYISL